MIPYRLTKIRLKGARLSLVAACMLLAVLSLSQLLMPAGSAESRRTSVSNHGDESAHLSEGYGKLPLRFEANRGQTSRAVKFLARGSGYTLFLTETGAVLRLRAAESAGGEGKEQRSSTLRLKLEGANRKASVSGLDELPGKSNYLVGADARAWLTGVPAFERVKYESVYKGIDVVYYGRQGRLEYDFVVAPGADPARIHLSFDGARSTRVDDDGDLVIKSDGGDVRQQRPVAYQEFEGARREVAARYALDARGRVRFELGDYDRGRTLVIDPVLFYSSYLGGNGDDTGTSIAVDAAGSAYVAGTTASTDFPGSGSLQAAKSDFNDAFVLKLSPDGKSLVYATYLGGNGDDSGNAVAVDAAGNAYVGGLTGSVSFPVTAGSFQTSYEGGADAFLAKLNPTGTGFVYSTFIGGKGSEQVNSIAVDAAGAAYVAGRTDSPNFTNIPSANRAGSPVYKSTDSGASWGASASGLTASSVNDFAVAPGTPNIVYASASLGVYRSTDGGANWQLGGQARPSTAPFLTRAVVVDSSNSSIVYAATGGYGGGLFKSIDGGLTFDAKASGIFIPIVNTLAINPATPTTLYAGTPLGIFKTTNGGDSWTETGNFNFNAPSINKIVIDPSNPQTVYAGTSRGVLKTTDGGANWTQSNNGLIEGGSPLQPRTLALDPSNPAIIYAVVSGFNNAVYKSTDGAANWTKFGTGLTVTINGTTFTPTINAIMVDPASSSVVYAATSGFGIFKSTDGGANWAPTNTGLANRSILALASRPGSPSAILAGAVVGSDPFVMKFNPAGSTPEYMRLLGGSENDDARGVALGPNGSAYVVGTTAATDFPVLNARQSALGGSNDAYVVKLDASGNTVYSTYLGGSSFESGAGVAVSADGSAYVTGVTSSTDFPVANAFKSTLAQNDSNDAFVTKLSPDGQALTYSTYLGGTNLDQAFGIAVGADGSAYVAGLTGSADYPLVGVSSTFAGFADAFVTKLNPAGSALLFSTCFGGGDVDQANAVALDGAGGIYLAGTTSSTNLPLSNAVRGTYGGGRSDAFVAKFGPGVDLAVTMTDSPDPVAFGADLTYSVKVRNKGDLPATGVRLTDTLPTGASFVSAATDRGSCTGTATVVCDIGTLAGGEEANVTIKVKPPAVRTINNTATATLNETDAVTSNNSATAETTVNFADLAVTKSVLNGKVAPGAKVVFLLTVTNKSGAAAPSVTLSDVLPAGLTFVSCDAPNGVCGGAGNSRTITFSSLAVGATEGASIAATLDASVAAGSIINNTATVSSTFPDTDSSNNSASAAVTATPFVAGARSNGKVVLATGEGIYTVNPDGTGRTKIHSTPPNTAAREPVWSPDGTKIVFQRNVFGASFPNSPYEFYVMNADGSNVQRVAGSIVDSRATWSPDGSHIAYLKFNSSTVDFDLYAVSPDGTGESRIARSLGIVKSFDWSPDGSRFVYQKNNQHIFVMDADGSNQRQLTFTEQTADGSTHDEDPFWSFDGARITFTRRNNVAANVYIINADGTALSRLNNTPGIRGQLSPDGTKLVYEGGPDGVAVANVDGTDWPVSLGTGSDPSWQSLPNPNPTPTPTPVETFSISGHVTPFSGGLYTTLRLLGTRAATITTDAAGNYTFIKLPKGGTYTVTPVRNDFEFATYTPASRTVSDLQADVTGFDFVGARVQHFLSGRMMDEAGNPLAGVRVQLQRAGTEERTTDAQGRYSFTSVFAGQFWSLLPLSTTYSFDPFRVALPPVTGDLTVNFVGVPIAGVRALQGRIIDTSGKSVAGLPVTLSGARNVVVRTNSDGIYAFYNLPVGQSYTVTPSTADGLGFTPAQRNYPSLDVNNTGLDGFIATSALPDVQFAATNVSVAENARLVELTLTRGPDPQLAAYVDFETSDLNASERSDYIATFGTVRFKPGETSQKLRVLITDDNLVEGERAFKVTLKGARNAFLGAANEAVVRIADDDTAASTANPLDSSQFFVAQHYADFLNRVPDDSGLQFWTNEIEQCGANAQCREVKRINVSAAFFLSIEFQETGYLVYKIYKAAFGTGEVLGQKTFLKDSQEIGRGVVVGQGDWRALLDANKQSYMNDFVLRPEFQFAYPQTLAPAVLVDTLNANTGGALSQAERNALVAGLTSGALSRAAVLRSVVENAEFSRRETNRAFVLTQYYGYLRRAPNDPPDSDFNGWQFWLNKLNEHNGNYIEAEMVKAFITSDEYRKRFGRQ